MEPLHELSHWSDCRIDRIIREVYISFQISRRVFLGLSALTIHAQRKCLFLLTLQTIHWLFFLHAQADHDGREQFLRLMQKVLWGREVMERKPPISFYQKYFFWSYLDGFFFSEILKKEWPGGRGHLYCFHVFVCDRFITASVTSLPCVAGAWK